MNGSGVERMPDRWIIDNPWLRNAFRHPKVEPATPVASEPASGPKHYGDANPLRREDVVITIAGRL